eukprot:m.106448 g.106448  ORF g.106448 m.106448 type:complete len:499 (+) comp9152_c0_seq1:491-1987(+)
MGRKKITIKKISNDRNRQVTLTKRKYGLMKKAFELSILCQCEIALIIIGDDERKYVYGSHEIGNTLRNFVESEDDDVIESHTNRTMKKLIAQRDGEKFDDDEEDEVEQRKIVKKANITPTTAKKKFELTQKINNLVSKGKDGSSGNNKTHHHHNNGAKPTKSTSVSTSATFPFKQHLGSRVPTSYSGTGKYNTRHKQHQLPTEPFEKQVIQEGDDVHTRKSTGSSTTSTTSNGNTPSSGHGLSVFIPKQATATETFPSTESMIPTFSSMNFDVNAPPFNPSFPHLVSPSFSRMPSFTTPMQRKNTFGDIDTSAVTMKSFDMDFFSPGLSSPVAGDIMMSQRQQQHILSQKFAMGLPPPPTSATVPMPPASMSTKLISVSHKFPNRRPARLSSSTSTNNNIIASTTKMEPTLTVNTSSDDIIATQMMPNSSLGLDLMVHTEGLVSARANMVNDQNVHELAAASTLISLRDRKTRQDGGDSGKRKLDIESSISRSTRAKQ